MLSELDRPIRILLAEDNPGDARLTHEALKATEVSFELTTAKDGQVAIDMLEAAAENPSQRPDIILLDLNMPKRDGHEVLAMIKAHPELRRIPVTILTTSTSRQDLIRCYDNHANAYMTKPTGIQEFMTAMRSYIRHWADVVQVPVA